MVDRPWSEQTPGNEDKEDTSIMISLHSCPRCGGAVLEYPHPHADAALCINCGWRRSEVPPEIRAQVEAHLGKPYMEDRYTHTRIGTGKAPLSGWDRVKRRRERARTRQGGGSEAALSEETRARNGSPTIAVPCH